MDEGSETVVMEPRLWRLNGWTARVIKNEDDDGWAVEMSRDGDPEPALVGPWTMGRDKKNPKPLDKNAFNTLVKTASEVIRRAEHAALARTHKVFTFVEPSGRRIRAEVDLIADEEEAWTRLACFDDVTGEALAAGRVPNGFKANAVSVLGWLETRG